MFNILLFFLCVQIKLFHCHCHCHCQPYIKENKTNKVILTNKVNPFSLMALVGM